MKIEIRGNKKEKALCELAIGAAFVTGGSLYVKVADDDYNFVTTCQEIGASIMKLPHHQSVTPVTKLIAEVEV